MSSTALFRSETETAKYTFERTGPISVNTSLGSLSLHLTNDVGSLEAIWEELQQKSPCTTTQTFDWARAWARHILGPQGRESVIALGRAADGRVLFLWPFEITRLLSVDVLTWLGQKHANYNMGLFEPDEAAKFSGDDILRLLSAIANAARASAACLMSQPFEWDGVPNPFAKLPHQLSASSGFAVKLGDFNALYHERFGKNSRRNYERKQRKLAEMGPISFGWAETRDERLALIETMFAQRSRQYAEMGVGDIFDVHGRALYRELALLEGDNPSRLRLGYIKAGDQVAATFSGSISHNRLGVCFSSLAQGEDMQRTSPGALLLRHQIEEACAKGLGYYDIGSGTGRHKDDWCDIVQTLFDTFIAFKPQGYAVTVPYAAMVRAKGAIKANRYLWPLAQRVRQILFAHDTEPSK